MKKMMLLAALLAMVVVAAVPAIAQVSQSGEQENNSGDSSQTFTVTGGGDNSSSCQTVQGTSNTGNLSNNTGVLQYDTTKTATEIENGDFSISPKTSTSCTQQVNQAASASG